MKKNVGSADRMLRGLVAVGAVAISAAIGFSSVVGIVLVVVAAIMALTAATGSCPAYSLLRVSTCPLCLPLVSQVQR